MQATQASTCEVPHLKNAESAAESQAVRGIDPGRSARLLRITVRSPALRREHPQEDDAVRLLERFGAPLGSTAKIIDGQHAGMFHSGGMNPKPDMLPVAGSEEGQAGG